MPLTIRNDRKDVLFHTDETYDAVDINTPNLVEQEHRLNFKFGRAVFREMHFEGFVLGHGEVAVNERLHVESSELHQRVALHFMLRGEITAHLKGMSNQFKTSSHQHNITYTPDAVESLWVERQPNMEVFALNFSCDRFMQLAVNNGPVLNKYAEDVENQRPVYLAHGYQITPRMFQAIEEVRSCQFTGGLKKLFLQSKAIELLALQCEQVESESRRNRVLQVDKISRTDEERIYYARDLLLANAQDPLSLNELARKAGLNEFKLKNGFRKVFDNTVFGYLSDYRLDQAKQMIREGKLSFTDIADELGYSSLQHFSNAFRKKYGMSPREVKTCGY